MEEKINNFQDLVKYAATHLEKNTWICNSIREGRDPRPKTDLEISLDEYDVISTIRDLEDLDEISLGYIDKFSENKEESVNGCDDLPLLHIDTPEGMKLEDYALNTQEKIAIRKKQDNAFSEYLDARSNIEWCCMESDDISNSHSLCVMNGRIGVVTRPEYHPKKTFYLDLYPNFEKFKEAIDEYLYESESSVREEVALKLNATYKYLDSFYSAFYKSQYITNLEQKHFPIRKVYPNNLKDFKNRIISYYTDTIQIDFLEHIREVHDNTRWKGFKEVSDIEYEIKFRDNLGYIYSTGSVVEDLFNRTVSYDYIPYLELSEEIQSSLRGVSINTSNLELSSLDRYLAEIALALLSKTLKEMRGKNIGVSETYIKEY